MKVYLASRFSTINEIRERKTELEAISDIKVNSRWLLEKADPNTTIHELQPSAYLGPAIDDVEDIQECDAFVVFTIDGETPTKRGGRHWETGFAYGIGKPVIVCGPRENIFHFLPDVEICPTFEEVKQKILRLRYEQNERSKFLTLPLRGNQVRQRQTPNGLARR